MDCRTKGGRTHPGNWVALCTAGGATGAREEMERGRSWGQGPAKSNWAVGPEAGVGEAKGLWL